MLRDSKLTRLEEIDEKEVALASQLGKGQFATVYSGKGLVNGIELTLNQGTWRESRVAVKVFNGPKHDIMFSWEVEVLAQCDHPRIVKVLGSFSVFLEFLSFIYIVFEVSYYIALLFDLILVSIWHMLNRLVI